MTKQKKFRVTTAAGIAAGTILFIGSLLFITAELKENETITAESLKQIQLINSIHSSMAHFTMWQNTMRYADSIEQFTAAGKILELSEKIKKESQSLKEISVLDSSYTDKLIIAMNQLTDAGLQISSNIQTYQKKVNIEKLIIDYRSVYRIAEFHLSTVQELTIQTTSELTSVKQIRLVRFMVSELMGLLLFSVIFLISVTGRHKAEKTLALTEGELQDIFESMPSALITLNSSGIIMRMNRAAYAMCVQSKAESGAALQELFPFLAEYSADISEAVSRRNELSKEFTAGSPERRFSMKLFPMSSTQSPSAVIRFDDITEQTELAEQLRHTQKMNAIGQLAGGIAHDFNNVLGGILNAAELIREENDERERHQLLDLISDASTRAADLTRKLLTFSKKDIHHIEPVSLNPILESVNAILLHSLDPRISTVLHLEAGDLLVLADAANIQNMFLNLGINAGHAMPNGGTLIFSTSKTVIDQHYSKKSKFHLKPGKYTVVEVTDTGSGISPEIIDHIFDPFFTTKENGTGIGLAAAYGTIQQCGGEITVSSTLGEGTTFRILLQCADTEKVHAVQPHEQEILDRSEEYKGTILVVDDELIIRKSVSLILKRLGYKVILGENGLDGVELFRKNRDQIDLIILDMMMPVMSGDAALVKIREISSDVPVIICTGFAHRDNLENLGGLAVQGMITKPYTISTLSAQINSALAVETL